MVYVRLSDVIDSGTHGLLGEDLFAQCLKVNDAVIRTLDAERVCMYVCMYEYILRYVNFLCEEEYYVVYVCMYVCM